MAPADPAPPAVPAVPAGLVALAEDPERFVDPPEGADRVLDERFCVVVGPQRRWASVCRLRLADQGRAVEAAVREIRRMVEGIDAVVWNVGSSATPADLPDRLRALGLHDPDPPMEPLVAGLAVAEEPPSVEGVEVRRVASLEEHLAGLEIVLGASRWTDAAAADQRARAEDLYERRNRRGGLQWLAWVDGEPVAFGAADRAAAGLFLAGGSTLPAARGRGCYRALVRARWDEAVRLGCPGLAVQAQYGSSYPVLTRLGFTEVAQVHTLQ